MYRYLKWKSESRECSRNSTMSGIRIPGYKRKIKQNKQFQRNVKKILVKFQVASRKVFIH